MDTKWRWLLLLVSISVMGSCSSHGILGPFAESRNILKIKTGTAFGLCLEYCVTEIQIDSTGIIFEQRHGPRSAADSLSPKKPERKLFAMLDEQEWQRLLESLDIAAFARLDSVIGCPDCTDGGAEWIEIMTENGSHRVTFEYGDSLPGLESFLSRLRAIRQRFNEKHIGEVDTLGVIYLPEVQITDYPPDSLLADPFTIREATLNGDLLTLDVRFGGGCKIHAFVLYMSPSVFAESFPAQAWLYLYHDANSDLCKALLRRKLTFSIRPIINRYESLYQRRDPIILNILQFYPADSFEYLQVRYTPAR